MTIRDLIPWAVAAPTTRAREADAFSDLHRRMNRLFDDVWTGMGTTPAREVAFAPRLAVDEKEDSYIVRAELPGMTQEDVTVTLEDGVLTISGEKKREENREEKDIRYTELMYGSFHRALPVGDNVKPEDVKAEYKNGVLTVTLPKSEQKPQMHRIPISSN